MDPEVVKKEASALMSEATSNILYKCKCSVSFDVNWESFPNALAMGRANLIIKSFNRGMPSFCADDGIKQACEIKRVSISYGLTPSAELNGNSAEIVTNGIIYDGFDKVMSSKEKADAEKAAKKAPNP